MGHGVFLFEHQHCLGGQLREASVPPHKEVLADVIQYYEKRLQKCSVELHLGQEVDVGLLEELAVDAVFMATGARAFKLEFPGCGQANVLTAREVLLDTCPVGSQVLVVGGGLVGCETAELLATRGHQVQIVEMLPSLAGEVEQRTRGLLLGRLEKAGVESFTEAKIISLDEKEAIVEVQGVQRKFEADTVVMAVGVRPERDLAKSLTPEKPPCQLIGDCRQARNLLYAVREGCWVVRRELGGLASP